jgi:hypothetical protein
MANILTAVKEGIQSYWNKVYSQLHNLFIFVLLLISNVSSHFEDNRVLNDILKRLYTFRRRMVSKVYKNHRLGQGLQGGK